MDHFFDSMDGEYIRKDSTYNTLDIDMGELSALLYDNGVYVKDHSYDNENGLHSDDNTVFGHILIDVELMDQDINKKSIEDKLKNEFIDYIRVTNHSIEIIFQDGFEINVV